ncbi:MAG: hypothetical protein WCK46_02910 [Candidatus Adlerbacteria bacterium]
MNTALYYARALFALIEKKPKDGATYLHNLDATLKKRGHQKLLPKIFNEYRKLVDHKERVESQKAETPEQTRTRHLLELYRTLTKIA